MSNLSQFRGLAGSKPLRLTTLTGSGNFTPLIPNGRARVILVGGGAAGTGSGSGHGGGAGSTVIVEFRTTNPSYSYAAGIGGASVSGPVDGTPGGSTYFGPFAAVGAPATPYAGSDGGAGGVSVLDGYPGGSGGTPSKNGNAVGYPDPTSTVGGGGVTANNAGGGGNSYLGTGGTYGAVGSGYGYGGCGRSSQPQAAGGPGVIIVEEYGL